MLVVETIAKIRRAYFVQGKALKAISRELKISRKVVRKVIWSGATAFAYQFDWSHEIVVINGTPMRLGWDRHGAHMRLCHSRMPWLVSTTNLVTSGKRAGAILGPTFEENEAAAAAVGVGLWRGAFIPPWEWRRQR